MNFLKLIVLAAVAMSFSSGVDAKGKNCKAFNAKLEQLSDANISENVYKAVQKEFRKMALENEDCLTTHVIPVDSLPYAPETIAAQP